MFTNSVRKGSSGPVGRLCATLAVALFVLPGLAQAQIVRDFSARYSNTARGDIQIVGNTLLTCSTTAGSGRSQCAAARAGANRANNQHNMIYVDADANATFNSSSADFSLPAGAQVLWAGLYWGANTSRGSGGAVAPNAAARGTVLFRSGNGAYTSLNAGQVDRNGSTYHAFADVTSLVSAQAAGSTATYWAANVQSGIGRDRYAGWSLVVVVADDMEPPRSLTVFDGYGSIRNGQPATSLVSGFLTPPVGSFSTAIGAVVYEGDLRYTGDNLRLNGVNLSDARNPATNFHNSTISRLGSHVTSKGPNYINQLGYDIDVVDATGRLANGATSANVTFTSSGDVYYPGVLTFAVEVFQPVLSANFAKTIVQVNGAAYTGADLLPGDEITYEVSFDNTGNDPATNVVIDDALPTNTTFVSGSLEIVRDDADTATGGDNVGVKTDGPGDEAEFTAGSIVFRLGDGADGASGGTIFPADLPTVGDAADVATVRYTLRVIDSIAPLPATISNTADIGYNGQTTGDALQGSTGPVDAMVVQPPEAPELGVAKAVTTGPVDNLDGTHTLTYRITLENSGDVALSNLAATEDLATTFAGATFALGAVTTNSPSGTLIAQAAFTGTAPNTNLLTAASSLPAGDTGTIDIVVTVTPGANAGPYDNSVTASGDSPFGTPISDDSVDGLLPDADTDGDPGNDTGPTPVSFNRPPTANPDLDSTDFGGSIVVNVIGNDTDPDTGDTVTVTGFNNTNPPSFGTLTDNGDGTFTYVAPAVAPPGFTGVFVFEYTVSDSSGQTSTTTVTISVPPAQADLGVTKTVAPDPVEVGNDVVFTVTAQNFGALPVGQTADTQVTDLLPAGYTFVSATPQQGSYDTVSGVWNVGLLPAGTAGAPVETTLTITATVNASGPYLNTAAVTSSNAADFNAANDSATAEPTILVPSLSVAKTLSAGPTSNGDGSYSVSWDIDLQNTGDVALANVQVGDALASVFAAADGFTLPVGAVSTVGVTANPSFDGVGNTNLLTGADSLGIGATASIGLTVDVVPGATLGAYTNSADASADSPAGTLLAETAAAAAVTFVEMPQLDLTKTVLAGPTNNMDGSYSLSYRITLANAGDVPLSDVQLDENLGTVFAAADAFTMLSVASTDFATNPVFNGVDQTSLLAAGQTLAIGQTSTIDLLLTVTPGTTLGPYTNTVDGSAQSPAGAVVTPSATAPAVTFAEVPAITATKIIADPGVTNLNDGSYSFSYTVSIENTGDVPLTGVQATDDLDTVFAAVGLYGVNSISAVNLTANAAFDGSAIQTLLDGSDTLDPGESGSVTINIGVKPGPVLGPYTNTVTASGTSPAGVAVNSNPSAPAITFVENPSIGVAKTLVGTPTNNGDGSYRLVYELFVENTGDVIVSDVQVTDDLTAAFGAADSFNLISVVLSSGPLTLNPAYDGLAAGDTNLLTGADSLSVSPALVPGNIGILTLTVDVFPGATLGPYANTMGATALSPAMAMLTTTSTAADVTFEERPELSGLKSVTAGPVNNNDGSYDISFDILVENTGDVVIADTQIEDNLDTVFGAASYSVTDVSSADFVVNWSGAGPFDGSGDTNLLAPSNPANVLAVGASGTVSLTVRVTPAGNLGPYENTATPSGLSPAGTAVTAPSMTAPFSFPETAALTVVKTVSSAPVNNQDGSYTLAYDIAVSNSGDVPLSSLALSEDLAAVFGAGNFLIDSVTGDFSTAAGFDGDANIALLDGSDALAFGASGTQTLTLTITPGANLGPYTNSIDAAGLTPSGASVTQTAMAAAVTFTEAPALTASKTVSTAPVNNGDGSYTLSYAIALGNAGDVPLSGLTVEEDLAAVFGAGNFVVDSVSGDFTANGSFDGAADTALLTGADGLAFAASGSMTVTLTLTPGGNLGPYTNAITAGATSPAAASVQQTANAPAVTLTEAPALGGTKSVSSGPVNNNDGSYAIGFDVVLQNTVTWR